MDYENIAKQILQHIGGKENVVTLIHCMTRLRFTLKDESIAEDEAIKKTKGVVGVMKKAGQYQIIIGNDVGNVYNELCKLGNFANSAVKKQITPKKKKGIAALMEIISSIMAPVIPAIMGTAMIRIFVNLLCMIGILDTSGTTYTIFNIMGDSAFFFFPVLIAVSAAKRFCVNLYYAVTVALVMLHPHFIAMIDTAHNISENLYFMKYIPISYISYAYSIIPIIFAVWLLKYVEQLAEKIIPTILKNLLQPFFILLII